MFCVPHLQKIIDLSGFRCSTSGFSPLRFDLERREWKTAPVVHQGVLWRGNAAGWVSRCAAGEELWVHGGHLGDDNQPRQILLRLQTGLTRLVRQTVRGISVAWSWKERRWKEQTATNVLKIIQSCFSLAQACMFCICCVLYRKETSQSRTKRYQPHRKVAGIP